MNAKILPLGTVCSIISPLTLRWISIEARGRGAGAGGTRPLVCPLVMSECIIYEKSRTRLVGGRDGVRYIRAIQVNKTREGGRSRGRGRGGGGRMRERGKGIPSILKEEPRRGKRMGRARDYRRLRAPSLVIVSNLNAPVSPGGKIVFYMRLEALRSSLVTIRPLLLLQFLAPSLPSPLRRCPEEVGRESNMSWKKARKAKRRKFITWSVVVFVLILASNRSIIFSQDISIVKTCMIIDRW